MSEGYFSSTRGKSIDIFHFTTIFPQPLYNVIQKENRYCFRFSDDGDIAVDTVNLRYIWDFGDDSKGYGSQVAHCFKTSGTYHVKLDIVDRNTGNIFFSKLSYDLELFDFIQPYIKSVDEAIVNRPVSFDGNESNLPGYEILDYTWDFGDGQRVQGSHAEHTYSKKGDYLVNMGLRIRSNSTGEIRRTGISKRISLFASNKEESENQDSKEATTPSFPDINTYKNARIKIKFSAESESEQPAVFCIELFSSPKKLGIRNSIFNNIPDKYKIREIFSPIDSSYSYVIDQQMSLMATYPAYKELHGLGFKNIRIKLYVLTDPAEKELFDLVKINGVSTDYYFDISDRLTSNAYIMLDQIVKLLNRHPEIGMEVGVHTDSLGPATEKLKLSQSRADLLVNYMITRGIKPGRIIPVGYGSSLPIAPNFLEKDRKLNRRIDFRIIK